MAITYPLNLPTVTGIQRGELKVHRDQNTHRAYSNKQVVQQLPSSRWVGRVVLPTLSAAQAAVWMGWLESLNGMVGTFLLPHPDFNAIQGTAGPTALIKGASQTGTTLLLDGVSAGATILQGDILQIGTGATTQMKRCTADATADGSGNITVEVSPPCYASPADNETVYLTNQKGLFRLMDGTYSCESDVNKRYDISFAIEEAPQA